MSDKIRVIIAHRHALVRHGLRVLLTQGRNIEVIDMAEDGSEAVELFEREQPDVLLIDIYMPTVSGLQATSLIRRRHNGARVIILAVNPDDDFVRRLVHAGAAGCVLLTSEPAELLEAVRVVKNGGRYLPPELSDAIVESHVRRLAMGGFVRQTDLSDREVEVLQLVAEGMGNQAIAQRLTLSVKTVEAHKAHISQKLGVKGRTELIKHAIRKGLIELEASANGHRHDPDRVREAVVV